MTRGWNVPPWAAAPAAVAVALAISSVSETAGWSEAEARLQRLLELDTRIDREILELRLGAAKDYDALVAALAESRSELGRVADFAAAEDVARAEVELADRVLGRRGAAVESFQAANAILRNSSAYFPSAAHALSARIGDAHPVTRERISALFQYTLEMQLEPSDALGLSVDRTARALADECASLADASRADCEAMTRHALAILASEPRVSAALEEAARARGFSAYRAIHGRLATARAAETTALVRARAVLGAVAVSLAGIVAVTLAKLHRRTSDLTDHVAALVEKRRELSDERHAVMALNATLEARVNERTEEVREAHARLVLVARKAGMAEVATEVLHTIGNKLNSLNVSVDSLRVRAGALRVSRVAAAARLLRENAATIGDYLASDPRGKLIPGFLEGVGADLEAREAGILAETAALKRLVSDVGGLVAVQRTHLGGGGEQLEPIEFLVDEVHSAVRERFAAEGVLLALGDVPRVAVSVDGGRVAHLLANILRHALGTAGRDQSAPVGGVTLGLAVRDHELAWTVETGRLRLSQQELADAFSMEAGAEPAGSPGSLHMCAFLAQELRGSLAVTSDAHTRFVLTHPHSGVQPVPERPV